MKENRLPEAQEPLREEPKLQAEATPETEPKPQTQSRTPVRETAADTESRKSLYRAPRRTAPKVSSGAKVQISP